MSALNIIFACLSSIVYFGVFYGFRELAKVYDWSYSIGIPCLIAVTLLLNLVKDKISEKDPSSKLHKVNSELTLLKSSRQNSKNKIKVKYEKEIQNLKNEIASLQKTLNVKDTIIHGIKNGITTNLIKHGSSQESFFEYAKELATKINSDLDVNTLAPVLTPETRKYIDMLK